MLEFLIWAKIIMWKLRGRGITAVTSHQVGPPTVNTTNTLKNTMGPRNTGTRKKNCKYYHDSPNVRFFITIYYITSEIYTLFFNYKNALTFEVSIWGSFLRS